MKKLLLLASLVTFTFGCQDDEVPLTFTDYTTYFGSGDETYHTGYSNRDGNVVYQRNATGAIAWKVQIDVPVGTYNRIEVLSDGSCLVSELDDNRYYHISSTGTLIWSTAIENSYGKAFVNDDEVWIPVQLTEHSGLLALSLATGNLVSDFTLIDFPNNITKYRRFSFHDGAVYMVAEIDQDFIRLAKFDSEKVHWVEDNNEELPYYFGDAIIHHQDGFSVLFDGSNLTRFNADGELQHTITTENFTYFSLFIPKPDGSNDAITFHYGTKELVWYNLANDLTVPFETEIIHSYADLRPCDFKQTPNGILVSLTVTETDPPSGQLRLLLKPDGTVQFIN